MRVLQVMAGARYGGAEKFFDNLTRALDRAGVEQKSIFRPFPERNQFFEENNLAYAHAPFTWPGYFKTKRVMRQVIDDFKPDIVMTWMSRASRFCVNGDFLKVARLGGYYDLKYYQSSDYLIGNTQHIVDYFLENNWPQERAFYLPNFTLPPKTSDRCDRQEYETPADVPLLLTLGRYHSDKAFDVLIRALEGVPKAYLWIGGQGDLENELKQLAKDCNVSDRVRFIPWRQDVSSLYNAADIYVCPSRVEPLGNVVIEGWAHKKPVVAAASSGPKGLITHGHDGMLSEIDDFMGMRKNLNTVIQDSVFADRIADEGWNTFQNSFTESAVVTQYLEFFNRIIDEKKVG